MSPWLTAEQAAERLNVSRSTIRRLINSGDLPAHRIGSKVVRVAASDVDKLLKPIPAGKPA